LLIANKSQWESDHKFKENINNCIQNNQEKVITFVEKLVDPATIEFGRMIIEASVWNTNNRQAKVDAENALKFYLQQQSDHELHSDFHQTFQWVRSLYENESLWKLQLKEDGMFVYNLKEEGMSIYTWKVQTKVHIKNLDSFVNYFASGQSLREDHRFETCSLREKIDENTSDWLICSKIMWPMAPREGLLRRTKIIGDKYSMVMDHTVTRNDTPPSKNAIRAVGDSGFFFEMNNTHKPGEVLFTNIYRLDPKGNIPIWIVNKSATACMKFAKKVRIVAQSK